MIYEETKNDKLEVKEEENQCQRRNRVIERVKNESCTVWREKRFRKGRKRG